MGSKPTQPPNIGGAVEIVPFTLTVKGKMTVPAGTHPDLIKASVMSQTTFSASVVHLLDLVEVTTDPAGLAVVKG